MAERAAAVAQVLVDDLDSVVLAPEDEVHLARVLRLKPGEAVIAVDGRGGWRQCRWTAAAALAEESEIRVERALTPPVTVGFCLLKGDRNEWVVQKLTELGVDRILLLTSENTVVRWAGAEKTTRNVDRLRRVSVAAVMQSRRLYRPEIVGPVPVATLLGNDDPPAIAHFGGGEPMPDVPVLVGPEGGWSVSEIATASRRVDLGPTVLRAETAALALGVRLCSLRAVELPLY